MRGKRPEGTCWFNIGVCCQAESMTDCRFCGWNPVMEHERKKILRETGTAPWRVAERIRANKKGD